MATKTKLIQTIYLYVAVAVSLLFSAIGTGIIINTGLKAAFFPEAEKRSYWDCNQQPPLYDIRKSDGTSEEQKQQIDNLLNDYQNWRKNNSGDKCVKASRENRLVDALTMVVIALPVCLVHWSIIRKRKEESEQ